MTETETGLLAQQLGLTGWLASPLAWGLLAGAAGLWIVLANASPARRFWGKLIAGGGLAVLLVALPRLSDGGGGTQSVEQVVFWLLAAVAVGCAGAAVTARNPVYTAIWFAGSLLGVAGLFLFQHAQFLGVTTVVVYAGAIVVTFLFVLMLANPEGHARYDRISWSNSAIPLSLLSGVTLVAVVSRTFSAPETDGGERARLLGGDHMVQLGTELFARHLVAVEVAGTLLLVALVGAVAIVMQGKEPRSVPASSEAVRPREGQP